MATRYFSCIHLYLRNKLLLTLTGLTCICFLIILFPGKVLSLENSGWNGMLGFRNYDKSDKYPTTEQLQAAKGVGSIRWSTRTGGPAHISGDLTLPSQEDPEIIAWRFLEEKKVLYGIKNPHENLRIRVRIDDKYATTIHFQQIYNGVRVKGGGLVVSVLPNGVLSSIGGEYYPEVEIDTEFQISAEEALNTAKQHWEKYSFHDSMEEYIVQNIMSASKAELTIVLTARRDYLVWYLEIFYWNFYIDAHNGVIREAFEENRIDPAHLGALAPSVVPVRGNIEVIPTNLDFGQEQIDSTYDYPTKEIVISNTEEDILIIRDVVLQGESFTIEEPSLSLPLPIMAGEKAVISIGFSPSETGNVTGLLSIESTDKDNPVVEVLLTGEKSSARPSNHEGHEQKSYFCYDLFPYGSLMAPFSLYEQPLALNINQDFSYCVPDFLFQNSFPFFSYLTLNNFFSQSFFFPIFNDYTPFPFYPSWE